MPPLADQVVSFYNTLFEQIFTTPFHGQITELLKRRAVTRQIEEAADAASQSLTRFFLNEQLNEQQATKILDGYQALSSLLALADVSNPNIPPESLVEDIQDRLPCPLEVAEAKQAAIYRIGLQAVVQVLTLVGPVVTEWQKLNYSTSFELLRRVVNRLDRISEQLDKLGSAGREAVDKRYELTYRDYLLQRFHRVEAGTVRMTSNLDIDLRELFVMPNVLPRQSSEEDIVAMHGASTVLMNLATARKFFDTATFGGTKVKNSEKQAVGITALEFVRQHRRGVIVGTPGSGKSTFLEWLQLKIAAVEEVLILGDEQAIPLLLRVRQLDAHNLPRGAELIAKATVSRDRADLMPPAWIERQMQSGRVLFMLDGLDETDVELRDTYLLPWLQELCEQYPQCGFLMSSRPVGYARGTLHSLGFVEADLLDFNEAQVGEYSQHWCTAIRLAQNEPEDEARWEGEKDGQKIVDGFKAHPYIRNLAHNPLMLSAICLVNYFEGGELPQDRSMLYQLCTEGLLHHWDQRRGIRSEYGLEEKLRVCREVAIAMQADDRAEYEAEKVLLVFTAVLKDASRAKKLLEHIRYRTGLLIERRPDIFAFAHLTFQEYLAACAVYEGNLLHINAEQLAHEYHDGRWNEVIALYCGLSTASMAKHMIDCLIAQPNVAPLSNVLTEAYLSGCLALRQDMEARRKVIKKVAVAPFASFKVLLARFATHEVSSVANSCVGKCESDVRASASHSWLINHSKYLSISSLIKRLEKWQELGPHEVGELLHLAHACCPMNKMERIVAIPGLYEAPGPVFSGDIIYTSQAEVAWIGLLSRRTTKFVKSEVLSLILTRILRVLINNDLQLTYEHTLYQDRIIDNHFSNHIPSDINLAKDLAILTRTLSDNMRNGAVNFNNKLDINENGNHHFQASSNLLTSLDNWANVLEQATTNSIIII